MKEEVQMRTEWVDIDPDFARDLLSRNDLNRTLNASRVREYARQMRDGKWQETHQGILIGRDMRLIDGQHRIAAVVESGCTVRMMVSFDERIDSPLGLQIDEGTQRAAHWVMGVTKDLWEVANAIAMIGDGHVTTSLVNNGKSSRDTVDAISSKISPVFRRMNRKNRTGFGGAKVRAGVIVSILGSPENERDILEQYRLLIDDEREGMWPIIRAFEHETVQSLIKRDSKRNPYALLIRTRRAFSATGARRGITQVRVVDYATELREVAEVIRGTLMVEAIGGKR